VLRIGDRVVFAGAERSVVALSGSLVRLMADSGDVTVVAMAYLAGAPDFAVIGAGPSAKVSPEGLLESLPRKVADAAREWERHLTEMETGLTPNAIPGLAYDMAVTVAEALHRATVLTGPGVKQGLERIRFLPAVTGGPSTHIAGGPHDHQLFRGDWLHYGRVRDGKLEFAGLFEPADSY
jgi:hypothetical protein